MYETVAVRQCQTAQDVKANAADVRERRQQSRQANKFTVIPKLPAPLIAIPEPIVLPPYIPNPPLTFLPPARSGQLDQDGVKIYPSIREIQRALCRASQIPLTDMLSPRRQAEIVKPRQLAMALCKRLTLKSLPEIGRLFGGKDHTTVLHSIRKMQPVIDDAAKRLTPDASTEDWAGLIWELCKTIPSCDYGKSRTSKSRTKGAAI